MVGSAIIYWLVNGLSVKLLIWDWDLSGSFACKARFCLPSTILKVFYPVYPIKSPD